MNLLTTFAGFGQPRYQWQPLTDSNWDTAANWVPTRLSPAAMKCTSVMSRCAWAVTMSRPV